jgi:hypothetical protein
MMKRTPHIGMVVAACAVGLASLLAPGPAAADDATKPTYNNYRFQRSGPNDNDYHANYHANYSMPQADYSVSQDGRRADQSQPAEERPNPREENRRFQDGNRSFGPYNWGRR